MKKLLLSIVITSIALVTSAQSFEGVIEFKKQTPTDTIQYIYYVKNDKIRLDEVGSKSKKVQGSFLLDLTNNTIVSLSHERKLYIEQASSPAEPVQGKVEVNKTNTTKTILGEKCSEYVVKNNEQKTQVTYWLASGKYDFFLKMLKLMNRKDKPSVYFQQIKNTDGMFPFLSSQINLETGKEEVKMEVTKVEKKSIPKSMFEIPKDYIKFQK
jgi:hypothetical protein